MSLPVSSSMVLRAGGTGSLRFSPNVAINGPGLYKGAVVVDAPFRADLYSLKAPGAAKMGLKVALLLDPKVLGEDADIAGINKSLQAWALSGEAKAYSPDPKAPADPKPLAEAVRTVLTPSAVVPAGAPTTVPK